MYSPTVTAAAIDAANRRLHAAGEGWELSPHTPVEIEEAIDHFDSLIDDDTGKFVRPLTPVEQRFQRNERMLCALDFRYWLQYAFLINWEKQPQRGMIPNVAQSIILDIWSEAEAAGLAIMLQELKARQLGCSLLSELAVAHRVQFTPYTAAVIASADPKKTIEMGKMIRDCWDAQPWWLMPDNPTENPWKIEKGMPVEFPSLHSSILIQAGNQFHGVARGQTPNVYHLSEAASWPDAALDIDASLLQAIHETPDVLGIIEGTAEGNENWFHDHWELIKVDYPRGRSRMRPLFLPWFVGTDIWPSATDLRARPIPGNWIPEDRTIKHAERARSYVLTNPPLFKHLAKGRRDWQMPREQMWFYEISRDKALRMKELNEWLAEMPSDDNEAFQSTGHSIIDQDVITIYRESVQPPLGVYAITGPYIHPSLIPSRSQWDLTKPVIRVPLRGVCRADEIYTFIPLKFEGYSGYDYTFKLFVYQWPEDGLTFGVGVDTSDGCGKDNSVIEVFCKGDVERPHRQAAEWASNYVKSDQLWPMTLALSSFYSVIPRGKTRRVQCRVAIECLGNGEIVQDQMKLRGWSNFHPWKRLDNRHRVTHDRVHKEGVFTNLWFRLMMMDRFLTAVDEQALEIGSYWFVDEMAKLVRDPQMASARADRGAKDDRVMAGGFILYSLTQDDRPQSQTYRRSVPCYLPEALDPLAAGQSVVYPRYRPEAQGRDLPGRVGAPVVGRRGGRLTLGKYRSTVGGGW